MSLFRTIGIPEGIVDKLEIDGQVIYERSYACRYVSLGDSIAAGQRIAEEPAFQYPACLDWQYGTKGVKSTEIQKPGDDSISTYTKLLGNKLQEVNSNKNVSVKCFARSGDLTENLYNKLANIPDGANESGDDGYERLKYALKNASIVTLCIGANTVLGPAMNQIMNFVTKGDPALKQLDIELEAGFALLAGEDVGSYKSIFNKLLELTDNNPNTKFIFTTVYNPYKYLWLDETNDSMDYKNGYFSPVLTTIPDWELTNPITGTEIVDLRKFVYEVEVAGMSLKKVTERVNDPAGDGSYSLAQWVEGKVSRLNQILSKAVADFNDERFKVADTKTFFEGYPDRWIAEGSNDTNYSDLVSVEIVHGQNIGTLNWGGVEWSALWSSFDIQKNINEVITGIANMLLEDLDPHPERDGQNALYHSFAHTLGLDVATLKEVTLTLKSNGGSGADVEIKGFGINNNKFYVTLPKNTFEAKTGYRFIGWNEKQDGTGKRYRNGDTIGVSENTTLYAQWSNQCIINYNHTRHTGKGGGDLVYSDDDTGHMECYSLYINGVKMDSRDEFKNGNIIYSVPYGSKVRVEVKSFKPGEWWDEIFYDDATCYIYWNNGVVRSGYTGTSYEFTLTDDLNIDFQWKIAGSIGGVVTGGDHAKSWEDCRIETFDASYSYELSQPYTISFAAGTNGQGEMLPQKILKYGDYDTIAIIKPNAFTTTTEGYRFVGWNTGHSDGQPITLNSSLILTANWSNMYKVAFYKSFNDYASGFYGTNVSNQTGVQEIYGCDISTDGGKTYSTLDSSYYRGYFASSGDKLIWSGNFQYGTKLRVWVTYTLGEEAREPIWGTGLGYYEYKKTTAHIYLDDLKVSGGYELKEANNYSDAIITITSDDTKINFEWALSGVVWVDATANWNCYISTSSEVTF